MVSKILDFLFGKSPDIFDADGNIVHKFPAEKWKAWNDRFENNEYDFRQHKGTNKQPHTVAPKK